MENRHIRSKAAAVIIFVLLVFFPWSAHAGVSVFAARQATGGGSEALDALPALNIGAYDFVLLLSAESEFSVWKASNDNAPEGWPLRVRPDDVGGGVTTWHRASAGVSNLQVYGGATVVEGVKADYLVAGNSVYLLYSGVTLTSDMLAGGIIYNFSSAAIDIGIPAISGSTACFLVKDMTGTGVTVRTTDMETMYAEQDVGTRLVLDVGNSRDSAAFQMVTESGTCKFVDVLGTVGTWTISQ